MASIPRAMSAQRMKAPPHPFPELQGPFEESMTELERAEENEIPSDAASRRTILLDAPTYERVIAGRWKQRPGEKYHPLWKIVAQLSFGLHLLAENLAKSEEEVMQILQGHIDEIDLFLERTTEDFALAQEDIQERMRCLQLPLQHPQVFDRMLEDRTFRNSIVDGNEKIEHIVARTSYAMRDSLKDAQKGLDATSAMEQYLSSLEYMWGRRTPEHEAVFEAMIENVEGWRGAFIDLHAQGDKLGRLLKQLTEVINQMQQRAGEVSRKLIRQQQRNNHSPTKSTNITYVTRQSTSSAGDSRSSTPNGPPRKPLPVIPNRDSARLSAAQSQRSGTAQSTRSVMSQRSSNLNPSRTSSREGLHSSARDSAQARASLKSPRIVEIKRQSPHVQDLLQSASPAPSELRRPDRSSSRIAELPAELPATSRRTTPTYDGSGLSTGLGIVQDNRQSQPTGPSQSSTAVRPGSRDGRATSSGLPLTPSSMTSKRNTGNSLAYELPCEPVPRHFSGPSSGSAKPAADTALSSPPSTPLWAKQTFDNAERNRMGIDKTAFRSHPPTADLGSPPVVFSAKFQSQTQHSRPNGSLASSIGAPGPETASLGRTNSTKSGSTDTISARNPVVEVSRPANTTIDAEHPVADPDEKAFVAELEGTTPFLLRPSVYTPEPRRPMARQVSQDAVELEAPYETRLPSFQPHEPTASNSTSMQAEDPQDYTDEEEEEEDTTLASFVMLQSESKAVEHKMATAIRKSFIATNIELPGSEHYASNTIEHDTEQSSDAQIYPPRKASSKGVDDIIAQLEKLNASSPNLSLSHEEGFLESKAEEPILAILPATTYVAERGPSSRSPISPVIHNQSAAVISPGSSTGMWSESGTPKSRPQLSARNSSGSTGSSQSQWRAFFKGQLSPAEFNSSTPQLPHKGVSAHKTIVDLQRRGHEQSPTLGWQWAPETPDVERRTVRRMHS